MVKYEELIPENGHVIGETACGHEGDLKKLKMLIDCVAEGGAKIIKFQIFIPEERATRNHPEWEVFNKFALGEEDWRKAAAYAREKNLCLFADIFGEKSLSIAKSIGVAGFKIHSEDLLNNYFITRVAQEDKIIMIGIGGAHRIEIYNLIDFLKKRNLLGKVLLTTGVQTFPTPVEAHSIKEVKDLVEKYEQPGVKIAFSDHISGELKAAKIVPLMALSAGASVIEKHVTVNRRDQWEDYQSALGKDEFMEFVTRVRELSPLLSKVGRMNSFEAKYRKTFKKSPAAARDLAAGQVISEPDIEYIKHATETVPLSSLNLVGKKLKTAVRSGDVMRLSKTAHKVGGIIVARCSSSRLSSKATRKILGRETIALLIERIRRCRNLDCVVLATSTDPSDNILEEIAKREGVLPFRGSLENLSLRFYEAAKHYEIDQIVRVTGDDILRDEAMIDRAVESHLHNSCDVTFTDNMPYGTSSEVFSLSALETILNTAKVPSNTEYLEWFLENDRYFSVNYVKSDYQFNKKLRLTLDYEEDFMIFTSIFEHFYENKPNFTLKEVLEWLRENPAVMDINKHKVAKYTSSDIDVGLKI